jgi:selenocysteine-specific elongation factor
MKRLVLGVIGHVDHGKTALVRALTGQDTDRLPAEKERGISIALGFANLQAGPDADIDLIDMPGHERFVRTMISGATGIDAVLLVVAANEGIKPQTIEHVDIAGLLGLRRAVVAITKADLVSPDEAGKVADQAIRLVGAAGLDSGLPLLTSAVRGEGIDKLRETLDALAEEQQPRAANGIAYLPIDRAFSMAGHGPVVTGTLRGAAVTAGDTLELLPSRQQVRVRAIQIHGARASGASPGQRVALNLRNVETSELRRGMALAEPGALIPSEWLTLSLRSVPGAPPLKNGSRLRALFGTDEIEARLRLLDRDVLEPGEAAPVQLRCAEPVALPAGEHVILRLASPPQTLAGGKVLEAVTHRQRRNVPRILKRLLEIESLPPAALMAAEIERSGQAGTSVRHLSQLCALGVPRVIELLHGLPVEVTRAGLVLPKDHLDRLLSTIPAQLARHPDGLSREALHSALPKIGAELLDEALTRLLAAATIMKRGSHFGIPRPERDRARAQDEAELAARIADVLRAGRLSPLRPNEIATDAMTSRVVERLVRHGIVIRAVDRAKGKEILFHRDAIEEARRRLEPLLAQEPGLLVTEIAAALGISRKFTMPLLDHLDTIRFTKRLGDRRMLYAPSISRHERDTEKITDPHETAQEPL